MHITHRLLFTSNTGYKSNFRISRWCFDKMKRIRTRQTSFEKIFGKALPIVSNFIGWFKKKVVLLWMAR